MKKIIIAVPLRIKDDVYEIKKRYEEALINFQMIPLYLTKENMILISKCQGLFLPGGIDVNPRRYHQIPASISHVNDELDELEYQAITYAIKCQIPILGVCRGIQILNVYFHGTLFQNIEHHQNTSHPATNSLKILSSKKKITINSFHHQAIDQIAPNMEPFLISEDGIIEGIYDHEKKIIAVQYHPELNDPLNIFLFFANLCRNDRP